MNEPVKISPLADLQWYAYRDADTWKLRKVVMVCQDAKGRLIYRGRFFTSLFVSAKRRAALRKVKRLLALAKIP